MREVALSQLLMLQRGNLEDLPTGHPLELNHGRMLSLCLPTLHAQHP